jgi:transposase InsO family protein
MSAIVDEIVQRYSDDPYTAAVVRVLKGEPEKNAEKVKFIDRYFLEGKSLMYCGPNDETPRLVVPGLEELIQALLFEFHDVEVYGHPGIERTLRLVERLYYWRHMMKSVRAYVKSCETCQRTKPRNTKPPGLLQSQPIARGRWTHVAMDFIVALPTTHAGFDSVLVVVDQLTKRAHFVPCKGTATAREIAELYRDRTFVLHGVPVEILSDRDPKFTATVWRTLCGMLGTRQKLTSAFRHQANGVTERLNQTIENYLRAFTSGASDDWDEYISLAEFAYNSRYQQSISMAPFEADLGYLPSTPATLLSPPRAGPDRQRCAQGKTFLEHQADRLATIRRELQRASDRMSEYYNTNRPVQSFAVGEDVLLSTENLANYHAGTSKAKLGARRIGPYRVAQRLGHDYYEIKLPKGVKFHPVFHTSYLKPYIPSGNREQRPFKVLLPDNTEGELVEDIVDHKCVRGKVMYNVKWLGQARRTWEPVQNLKYVAYLINRYHQRKNQGRASS